MPLHHEHPNFNCPIEISPFVCRLTGGMQATIYEDGEEGPQQHIRIDRDWYVDVEWYLHGHLTRHLCGSFCIGVHLESIGAGEEFSLGPEAVVMEPCGDGHYRHRFKVNAGRVSAGECGTLYEVAVTLTSKDSCGGAGHIAAFCKEGCVMFVEPPAG